MLTRQIWKKRPIILAIFWRKKDCKASLIWINSTVYHSIWSVCCTSITVEQKMQCFKVWKIVCYYHATENTYGSE